MEEHTTFLKVLCAAVLSYLIVKTAIVGPLLIAAWGFQTEVGIVVVTMVQTFIIFLIYKATEKLGDWGD